MDYPICRACTDCPLCGHPKKVGMLMCWLCHRGGKTIPDFGKVALDRFENSPKRIAEAQGAKVSMTQDQIDMLWRFAWLCDELRAGNAFSSEALHRWAMQARNAAHGTKPRSDKTAQVRA